MVADDQEENRGASHLFVVRSFDLPDSGKTLLILRNNHEAGKLGTANNIIDVVGTLGIAIKTATFETKRWPLSLSGAPNGNVIEPGDEELAAGKVYTRANADKGSGSGEKHIGVAGYTGLGYDRAATPNAANGGNSPATITVPSKGNSQNLMMLSLLSKSLSVKSCWMLDPGE